MPVQSVPESVKTISKCRVCNSKRLLPVLSLGNQFLADFAEAPGKDSQKVPLELIFCDPHTGGCGLLQLKHTTPPSILYGHHYWYQSGINQTMRDELADITRKVEELTKFRPGDAVLDIGCNDGTLLRSYKTPKLKLVGVDPAVNLVPLAKRGTTDIIHGFFSHKNLAPHLPNGKAKAITAISMFYDLDDPNDFVSDLGKCLDENGVCIIQQNYLCSMLDQNGFDNIVHEHLEYYSLLSMENLLKRHDLEVFDVELRDINGGSFRTYIRRKGASGVTSSGGMRRVEALRKKELTLGLDEAATYKKFGQRARAIATKVHDFIEGETKKGKTVYVYGASTRGNMTVQFCNLDNKFLKAAAERNPDKWGKKTIGTSIPIISEEQARRDKPDYFLVLPWQFLNEFKQREAAYLKSGGKFIVPLPEFQVMGWEDAAVKTKSR